MINKAGNCAAKMDRLNIAEEYAMCANFNNLVDPAIEAGGGIFQHRGAGGQMQPFGAGKALRHRHITNAGEYWRKFLMRGREHIHAQDTGLLKRRVQARISVDADQQCWRLVRYTADRRRSEPGIAIRPRCRDDIYRGPQPGHCLSKSQTVGVVNLVHLNTLFRSAGCQPTSYR